MVKFCWAWPTESHANADFYKTAPWKSPDSPKLPKWFILGMFVELTFELKDVIQFALTAIHPVCMSHLQIDIFMGNLENTGNLGEIYNNIWMANFWNIWNVALTYSYKLCKYANAVLLIHKTFKAIHWIKTWFVCIHTSCYCGKVGNHAPNTLEV